MCGHGFENSGVWSQHAEACGRSIILLVLLSSERSAATAWKTGLNPAQPTSCQLISKPVGWNVEGAKGADRVVDDCAGWHCRVFNAKGSRNVCEVVVQETKPGNRDGVV